MCDSCESQSWGVFCNEPYISLKIWHVRHDRPYNVTCVYWPDQKGQTRPDESDLKIWTVEKKKTVYFKIHK